MKKIFKLTLLGVCLLSSLVFAQAQTCNAPSGLSATNVSSTSATLNWSFVYGTFGYVVRYKPTASSSWASVNVTAYTTLKVTGLTASTDYEFQVKADCSDNSASTTFTTLSGPVSYCTSSGTNSANQWHKLHRHRTRQNKSCLF